MAETIRDLKKKINEQNLKLKNLRETNKQLTVMHAADQKNIVTLQKALTNLQKASLDEIATEYLGVYLKWITEQHGTDQYDEETGEPIGKMLAFTFQEKNNNKFNMMPMQNSDGLVTMVCASTYPIEEGEENED